MKFEYLYADDCPICTGLKKQGIVRTVNRVLTPLPNVYFVEGTVGRVTETLEVENGSVTQRPLLVGSVFESISNRRPQGYENLGTPMFHLVNGETYDEHFVADFFDTENEMTETIERSPANLTWMILYRVFRFYLRETLDISHEAQRQLREGLAPDQGGDVDEWQDAFTRAYAAV